MNLSRLMMDELKPSEEALRVIAECVSKQMGLTDIRPGLNSFKAMPPADSEKDERPGIISVNAKIMNEKKINALFEVLSTKDRYFANLNEILSCLHDTVRSLKAFHGFRPFWDKLEGQEGPEFKTLGMEFYFNVITLTPTVRAQILNDIAAIDAGAAVIKKAMGEKKAGKIDISRIFGEVLQAVEPVIAGNGAGEFDENILSWARSGVIDYIMGGSAGAIYLPHAADEDLAIGSIAAEGENGMNDISVKLIEKILKMN